MWFSLIIISEYVYSRLRTLPLCWIFFSAECGCVKFK